MQIVQAASVIKRQTVGQLAVERNPSARGRRGLGVQIQAIEGQLSRIRFCRQIRTIVSCEEAPGRTVRCTREVRVVEESSWIKNSVRSGFALCSSDLTTPRRPWDSAS